MPPRSTPSTPIGDDERLDAQRALQSHLDAGRLQLAEFVERFSRAADAMTAAELATLFADLPAPHPALPGSAGGRARRTFVIIGAVAAVVLVGLLGVVVGRDRTAPASFPVAAPSTATPVGSAAASAAVVPNNPTVRRTTGPGLITLRPSDDVDLDDVTGPDWNVGAACCGRDIGFAPDAGRLAVDGGHAAVTGPLEFATCLHATYIDSPIERGRLQPGAIICVRTDEHRFALVTIVAVTEQAIGFGATVWDPPVP